MKRTNNDVTASKIKKMAVLLKMGSLVPTAVRVALSGGAAYGTVKYGVWTDSSQSREKLERLKNSVEREIQYPQATMKTHKVEVWMGCHIRRGMCVCVWGGGGPELNVLLYKISHVTKLYGPFT